MTRNNIFGIRESIGAAAGLAMGHPLGALATAVAGKALRERGAAMGAYALGRMADSQLMTKMVTQLDQSIAKASRGLLAPPKSQPLPETPKGTPRARAVAAMTRVAQLQSDPQGFADRVAKHTEAIQETHPEIANAVQQRQIQAAAFLASKVPVQADRDPLDPHPAPKMTDAQAAEFARYAWYADKPTRFFAEVAHGKLTPEGAETARELMPQAFAQLQTQMADAIATNMAKGVNIPFQQRQQIGSVLGFAAVPSQRPDHAATLQRNVQPAPDDLQSQPAPKPGRVKGGAVPTAKSALDRLEERGAGR